VSQGPEIGRESMFSPPRRAARESVGRRRRRHAVLWCATAAALAATDALAANKAYIGASGSFWSGPANWNAAGVPVNGDVVTIGSGLPANFILNFDAAYTGTGLTSLNLDPFSGNVTIVQSTGTSVLIA